MGAGDTFSFYQYTSDDTTVYAVKLSAVVAAQGGFATAADPTSTKVWPYGSQNMRKAYGETSTGKRTHLPIATAANTKYISGGSFTLAAGEYTIQGLIGEKRKLNSIA
jgi:hypothetical protein